MNPPINKDWWAAAAAVAGTMPVAMGQVPPAPPPAGRVQAGVVTSVAPQSPTGFQTAPLFVDSASNQRVVNNTQAPMHVLFSDQSAVTLAPGAEIMIAQYRYDAAERRGNIAINLFKGVLRVVGGQISKTNPTQVRTATATVGIRGGISLVEYQDTGERRGETDAKFLFGEDLTFRLDGGQRPSGGSAEGGPELDVDGLRTAGWFTDGEGGDSGQGQPLTGDAAAIVAILTKPGWSALAGATTLMTRIQTGSFTAASLQAALSRLQGAGTELARVSTTFTRMAVAMGGIADASRRLVPAPAPTPGSPPAITQGGGSGGGGSGNTFLSNVLGGSPSVNRS
jgi:hypothetical protein